MSDGSPRREAERKRKEEARQKQEELRKKREAEKELQEQRIKEGKAVFLVRKVGKRLAEQTKEEEVDIRQYDTYITYRYISYNISYPYLHLI